MQTVFPGACSNSPCSWGLFLPNDCWHSFVTAMWFTVFFPSPSPDILLERRLFNILTDISHYNSHLGQPLSSLTSSMPTTLYLYSTWALWQWLTLGSIVTRKSSHPTLYHTPLSLQFSPYYVYYKLFSDLTRLLVPSVPLSNFLSNISVLSLFSSLHNQKFDVSSVTSLLIS